jgi:hypothetical protein
MKQAPIPNQFVDLLVLPSYMGLAEFLRSFDLFSENVVVATNNSSVLSFLKLAGIRYLEFPSLGNDLSRAGIGRLKCRIESVALTVSDYRVHYGFYLSNVPALFFIQELAKSNKSYFWNCDPIYKQAGLWNAVFSKRYRKSFFTKWIYALFLGLNCEIYNLKALVHHSNEPRLHYLLQ